MDLDKEIKNLISIDGKRNSEKKKSVAIKYNKSQLIDDEDSAAEVEISIYNLLCGNYSIVQEVIGKYEMGPRLFMDDKRTPSIFEHCKETNTYSQLQEMHVVSAVYHWYNESCKKSDIMSENTVGFGTCKKSVQAWLYQYNPSKNTRIMKDFPKQTRFKSDNKACFKRLDYDPIEVDDLLMTAPLFHSMLSRMKNSEAFCKIIGGMLDEKPNRKQSIWLWGPTDGGKSVIQKLVMKIVGGLGNTAVLTSDDFRGNHWKEPLVGKELWLVNEASVKFINSSSYKALTGDGTHQINPKGRAAYTVELRGHFLFTSNDKPAVENDPAIINRIIPCFIAPISASERMEEEDLWQILDKEIPYIVGYCLNKYKNNGSKKIECDKSSLLEGIEDSEWSIKNIFDRWFAYDETHDEKDPDVTCVEFQQLIDPQGNVHSQLAKKMKKFVEDKYGSKTNYQKRHKGKNTRWITNIRKLTAKERADICGF